MSEKAPHIWNCWTHNYIPSRDGFIIHAFDELSKHPADGIRSLCGVKVVATGFIALGENGWVPSCKRCRRALVNRGLIGDKVKEVVG